MGTQKLFTSTVPVFSLRQFPWPVDISAWIVIVPSHVSKLTSTTRLFIGANFLFFLGLDTVSWGVVVVWVSGVLARVAALAIALAQQVVVLALVHKFLGKPDVAGLFGNGGKP